MNHAAFAGGEVAGGRAADYGRIGAEGHHNRRYQIAEVEYGDGLVAGDVDVGLVAGGNSVPDPVVAHDVGEGFVALFGREEAAAGRAEGLDAIAEHAPSQLGGGAHEAREAGAEGGFECKEGSTGADIQLDGAPAHFKSIAVGCAIEADDQVGVDRIPLYLQRRGGRRGTLCTPLSRLFTRHQKGPQLIDVGCPAHLIDDREFGFAADRARAVPPRGEMRGQTGGQGFVYFIQRRHKRICEHDLYDFLMLRTRVMIMLL